MCKVFVEYTIIHEKRTAYLHYMQKRIEQTGLELIEGTDQPDLFVEIWSDVSYSAYLTLKEMRLKPAKDSLWEHFEDLILGGLKKQHIWHFSKPTQSMEPLL
jgi:hypothetical protein